MAQPQIIYLEAGEEITSVVDRLRNLSGTQAILVAPPGAILLQSVVNLKLLVRQSQTLGKTVAIVTTDRTGRNLAAQVGLGVASSLEELRSGPSAAAPVPIHVAPGSRVHQVPDRPEPPAPAPAHPRRRSSSRPKFSRLLPGGLALPAWLRRPWVPWAGAGLGILLLGLLLLFVLPTATVHLTPQADPLQIEKDVIIDASAEKIQSSAPLIIPGQSGEQTVEGSTGGSATGKKDVGNKATGSVQVKNCEDSSSHVLPAGSTLRSGGLAYTTNSAVTIPAGLFAGGGSICNSETATVGITASAPGPAYNRSNAVFTVPLTGNYPATGSASGGTTRQVTVVSEADVVAAKEKLTAELTDQAKKSLSQALGSARIIDEAIQKNVLSSTPSAAVGAEAASFTLQMKLQVKTIAFKESDLQRVLAESMKGTLGADREIITEEGKEATVTLTESDLAGGTLSVHASEEAFSARRYDASAVANAVKGKTAGEARSYFEGEEAIAEVKIRIWPSFKNRLPYFASRIKIKIETPKQ